MDDWQLIQDYVAQNSETAFRTLVTRHLNLVHAVALRQVRNPQLADEVAQAVFILLARKAKGFRPGIVVPGWLFRTTRFVASRAVRSENRRLEREKEAFAMQQLATPDDAWKRMAPAIDEALESLGETDRNAVLLRFFNEKSFRETAIALGASEEAAKKRVTRAVEKLRLFFSSRGFTLSTAIIGSALVANAATAAPSGLANSIAAAAAVSGATATTALPILVGKSLSAWRWARIKLAAGIGVSFVAILLTWRLAVSPSGAEQQPVANELSKASATAALPGVQDNGVSDIAASQVATNANNGLLFRVVDAQTGSGIAGARVSINYVQKANWWEGEDLTTDPSGACLISIPADLGRLDVGVHAAGYVQKFYTWRLNQNEPLPPAYNLSLEHGVPIGGWVRDESGQAVSSAEILVYPSRAIRGTVLLPDGRPAADAEVALLTFKQSATLKGGHFMIQGTYSLLARSDNDGAFRFLPDEGAHTVVAVHETGFGRVRVRSRSENVTVQLSPWGKVDGLVRTRDGNWSGRDIVLRSPHDEAGLWIESSAKSDADGRFSINHVPEGDFILYFNPGINKSFTDATHLEVRSGETTQAQMGGVGANVIGRLLVNEGEPVDWPKQIKWASLRPKSFPSPLPPLFDTATPEERRHHLDLTESAEAREWGRSQRPPVTLKLEADGSFVAEGVRAGEYELSIELAATPTDMSDPIKAFSRGTVASLRQPVTVTETQDQAVETIDLKELTLKPNTGQAR